MNHSRNLFQRGHWSAVLIGLPIVFLGLVIMTGGFNNAVSMVFFSIVCTIGIGLAFWLFIAWIVGWMILLVVEPLSVLWTSSEEPRNPANGDRWEGGQTALRGYIQRCLAVHATESQITNRLISQGWTEPEIEQAYQAVRGQQ